jgi:hypothetical protein
MKDRARTLTVRRLRRAEGLTPQGYCIVSKYLL